MRTCQLFDFEHIYIMSQPIKVDLGCFLELGYSMLFVEFPRCLGGLQPITFSPPTKVRVSCMLSWTEIRLHHPGSGDPTIFFIFLLGGLK